METGSCSMIPWLPGEAGPGAPRSSGVDWDSAASRVPSSWKGGGFPTRGQRLKGGRPRSDEEFSGVDDAAARAYDAWYDVHAEAYETELAAIRRLLPGYPRILEVGVGTGRFASRLGVRLGLEPSLSMAKLAKARSVRVVQGRAERMPFRSASVDAILMVTTLCSVQEPAQVISESARVLRPGGFLVLADIDPGGFLGPIYEARRAVIPFLRRARFHAVGQIRAWLAESGFTDLEVWQTLFHRPEEVTGVEPLKKGHGEGGMVIFRARRSGKTARGAGAGSPRSSRRERSVRLKALDAHRRSPFSLRLSGGSCIEAKCFSGRSD